ADFDPIVVYACQLILVLLLIGPNKTQPLIANFEVTVLLRRNHDHFTSRNSFIIEAKLFNHDWWRLLVELHARRINYRCSLRGGEPEPAVASFPTRRLTAAVAFQREQAVSFPISDRSNLANLSVGKIVQLFPLDPVDAAVAAHPEVTAPVFQNLKYAVIEQAFFHGVSSEAPIFETRQAAVIRADPENSLGVFVKRPNVIARQSVLFGVGREPSVSVARKPAPCAEPEMADAIL